MRSGSGSAEPKGNAGRKEGGLRPERLDFHAPASGPDPGRAWRRLEVHEIEVQELFARLTSQFEDAAALAAEGQRPGLTSEVAVRLLMDIRGIFDSSARDMAQIERRWKA